MMKEREEELNEKLRFLDCLALALRDGVHTDIMVKPGTGAPLAAHRALLVGSPVSKAHSSSPLLKFPFLLINNILP